MRYIKRLDGLAFVLSICGLFFAYGVVTVEYQIFPYELIRDAKRGLSAWNKLEPDDFPVQMRRQIDDPGELTNPILQKPGAGREYLLMSGGFHQNIDRCPEHGCLAWIIDRQGAIVHSWSVDPGDFVDDIDHLEGTVNDLNIYVSGMALDDDGGLVVIFQGRNTYPYQVGIARFAADGKLVWKRYDNSHHWPTLAPNGDIIVPAVRMIPGSERGVGPQGVCEDVVQSQGVRILGADGQEKAIFWFDDLLARADLPGILRSVPDPCNPHHVNGIAIVTPAGARYLSDARPGDLAVSLREPSVVAILDRRTGEIRDLVSHAFAGQHSPNFLADGSLIVFDNLGGDQDLGGTRIVAVRNSLGEHRALFPPPGYDGALLPVRSDEAGVTAISPDGKRVMISESRHNRIIEVDAATGEPLWAMNNIVNMKPFLEEIGAPVTTGYAYFSAQGAYYVPEGHAVLSEMD